jgi:hypothetical protein
MTATSPTLEHRLHLEPQTLTCAICGTSFESGRGIQLYIAGTDQPVCGREDCDDAPIPDPCDIRFAFVPLDASTIAAIRSLDAPDVPVHEKLRRVALDESLPEEDRVVLSRAAIDLEFCEADSTEIVQLDPSLVLRTCGEAAAELMLSECGDII